MRFVMSAIVLLAFVFILTSCNWSPNALGGKGSATSPYVQKDVVVTPPAELPLPSLPPCSLELYSVGDVYVEVKTLTDFVSITSDNGRQLHVRIKPIENSTPTLAALSYQARPRTKDGLKVIRALKCQDVSFSGVSQRDYECTVPAKGDADDNSAFFIESLALKFDGYDQNILFQEQSVQDGNRACEDRGDQVTLPDGTNLPVLSPTK